MSIRMSTIKLNTDCICLGHLASNAGSLQKKKQPIRARFSVAIHHLHISHNTPCLHNLYFSHLLGITAVPREIENNGYEKFWGANKVHFGRCTSGEYNKGLLWYEWACSVVCNQMHQEPITSNRLLNAPTIFSTEAPVKSLAIDCVDTFPISSVEQPSFTVSPTSFIHLLLFPHERAVEFRILYSFNFLNFHVRGSCLKLAQDVLILDGGCV